MGLIVCTIPLSHSAALSPPTASLFWRRHPFCLRPPSLKKGGVPGDMLRCLPLDVRVFPAILFPHQPGFAHKKLRQALLARMTPARCLPTGWSS